MDLDHQEIGLLSNYNFIYIYFLKRNKLIIYSNLFIYLNFRGPMLLGINAVIAESYERIHRSNLIGMGILPLEYIKGENAETLGLTGKEIFNIHLTEKLYIGQIVEVSTNCGKRFNVKARVDTEPEIEYYKDGGILIYVMKKLMH